MFEILGYIFVTILCFYLLVYIILIGINFFKDYDNDDMYRHIVCKTSFYTWSPRVEPIYILPGVSMNKGQRLTLSVEWICFEFVIEWFVQTDKEDDACYHAVNKLRHEP